MTESYTIDKISWHTDVHGNPESKSNIFKRFWIITKFLQDHNLTIRIIANSESEISDDFSIESSDLTSEGLDFMKSTYDKWIRKIDRGMDPSNVKFLLNNINTGLG